MYLKANRNQRAIPGRTLRLQPRGAAENGPSTSLEYTLDSWHWWGGVGQGLESVILL